LKIEKSIWPRLKSEPVRGRAPFTPYGIGIGRGRLKEGSSRGDEAHSVDHRRANRSHPFVSSDKVTCAQFRALSKTHMNLHGKCTAFDSAAFVTSAFSARKKKVKTSVVPIFATFLPTFKSGPILQSRANMRVRLQRLANFRL
jgi:hypothetical protein